MSILEVSSHVKFMQGNSACAEAAIAAGMRFFGGYPITPSTEIAEILSCRLPQIGGKFIQMEDEIAGIGSILGASIAGLKSMTATSGPGFSLMQELIGFAALCEIPCVIVEVQRGGPSTGLPTSPAQGDVMQARWGTHGDHPIIVLCPSSVKEMYELTIEAFNFSEKFRVPVILLADEVIAHMREKIEIPLSHNLKIINRQKPDVPPQKYLPYAAKRLTDIPKIANFGEGYRFNITGLIHDERGFPTNDYRKTDFLLRRLHEKINARRKEIILYDHYNIDDARTVLFSYGSTARSCQHAMQQCRMQGLKVGLIKAKTLWPFPEESLRLPSSVKTIIVCEMNLGQMINEVKRVCKGNINITGVNITDGRLIPPSTIIDVIVGV